MTIPEAIFTTDFHNDGRPTMVSVEGKLYSLILSSQTIEKLKKLPFDEVPHVRHLAPIKVLTSEQQKDKNQSHRELHRLVQKAEEGTRTKTLSLKVAARDGLDVPVEITKLLTEKKSENDPIRLRAIRKQLRKLGYKRAQALEEV